MKSTKVSRSSYITGTNLSQHHGKDTWIFDTAATSHFCCRKNSLQNFQRVNNMRLTVAVGGVTCEIKGTGTVSMIFQSEGGSEIVDFKNVLYSPKLQRNLISGSLIDKAGSNFIPISRGAMLGFKRKSYNVISNSDTETEEETEHQSSPKISKQGSSEQERASNNSNSSVKVIWERKAVPRKDKSRTDIYYYAKGPKDRLHCFKDIEEYCRKHNLEYDKSLFDFSGKNKYSGYVNMEESNLSD
ncbi:retrovirus-related Pol polyprotein from transposon TNT 1-94 [Trichonephila clavata]|uniref:Retrovirus-related Pol polyprotein from transposon TNT 1-94 n=1 Tax=Trichonephila clavata TaxID=2740835 RepID=A0A8X6KQ16_TRICU|nr:retrovirus-related Pol polyprotein from transposon TNT 1-94 [Trichonephila clavata]